MRIGQLLSPFLLGGHVEIWTKPSAISFFEEIVERVSDCLFLVGGLSLQQLNKPTQFERLRTVGFHSDCRLNFMSLVNKSMCAAHLREGLFDSTSRFHHRCFNPKTQGHGIQMWP